MRLEHRRQQVGHGGSRRADHDRRHAGLAADAEGGEPGRSLIEAHVQRDAVSAAPAQPRRAPAPANAIRGSRRDAERPSVTRSSRSTHAASDAGESASSIARVVWLVRFIRHFIVVRSLPIIVGAESVFDVEHRELLLQAADPLVRRARSAGRHPGYGGRLGSLHLVETRAADGPPEDSADDRNDGDQNPDALRSATVATSGCIAQSTMLTTQNAKAMKASGIRIRAT